VKETENTQKIQKSRDTPSETLIEAKCFELYYILGDLRNVNQLLKSARRLNKGITYDRLAGMKRRLFWEERIKARDYSQLVTLKTQAARNIDDLKLEFFDAIKNTVKRSFFTDKKTGERRFNLMITDIGDLEKSIKLMLLLAGEATDITSVKIEVVETIIQKVIQVVSLHIKDPKVLADIALGLNEGMKGAQK